MKTLKFYIYKTFRIKKVPLLALAFLSICPFPAKAEEIPFFATYPNIDLSRWYISSGWANGEHQSCEWRAGNVSAQDKALRLTLSDKGALKRKWSCGEIQTKALYSYGRYEARMKTAAGSGLNTAFFTYIGPPQGVPEHDEIDFEFLGKDSKTVQLNYYRKGQGGHEHIVDLGFDASEDFHDYAFDWLPEKIIWYIDGKQVHETQTGATDIPVNPSKIYLSLWSNAPSINKWMGPFTYNGPYTADYEWVKFTPAEDLKAKED